MFKIIKNDKTIAVSQTSAVNGLKYDFLLEDAEHAVSDYERYNGEYLLKSDIPAPTKEEQKETRAQAYLIEVDPITAHIQRERDEEIPDEEKIAALIAECAEKVAEIKARYPYPEDNKTE